MKAKPRLPGSRVLGILILCVTAAAGVRADEISSRSRESLPEISVSLEEFKPISASAATSARRLRLEVNLVEYPEEKGIDMLRLMGLATSPAAPQIEVPRVRPTGPVPEKPSFSVNGLTGPESPLSWILTKSLNEFIMDKLEHSSDAHVFAGPRIVAPAGEKTKLALEAPGTIVTRLGFWGSGSETHEDFDEFPTLYVEPRIKSDGQTIDLHTTQAIRDLIGYDLGGGMDDVWDHVESSGANPAPLSSLAPAQLGNPKPLYRLREATRSAVLQNGQTLVLSGFAATTTTNVLARSRVPLLGDLPIAGKLLRPQNAPKKKVLVFITPTLLGEDGKAIQQEDTRDK